MHEISLAEDIRRIAEGVLAGRSFKRVVRVRLKIGPLSGVNVDSLRFAMGIVAEGTPLDGVELDVDCLPLQLSCQECATVFEPKEFEFTCPSCASTRIKVISGDEMDVENIEIEE